MRAGPHIDSWMARLDETDRIVTRVIVRGEILYGISTIPELASNFYAAVKIERQRQGLPLARTTFGLQRRRLHWARHWLAATPILEASPV
jgi:predicted nucleic acid-binding protein